MFITDDGYLISNNHVVKDAAKVRLLTGAGLIDATGAKARSDTGKLASSAGNGHRAGAGEGRAGSPLPAAACQPMRSGSPRRRVRSDAPDHGGRLVAGGQDLANGSLGWTNEARGG